MESEQKFAIFISDAPRGRKWGAILSMIAAIVLAAALFVPSFSLGVPGLTESIETDEESTSNMEEVREELAQLLPEGSEPVADIYLGEKISVASYLVKYEPAFQNYMNYLSDEDSAATGGMVGILLLVLLIVFILVSLVCTLYTINVVSFVMAVCAITGILLVYMLRFRAQFLDLINALVNPSAEMWYVAGIVFHIGLPLIILLGLAGILQIVGLVLSYVIRDDRADEFGEDDLWAENETEGRNLETGLAGDNAEADFGLKGSSRRDAPAATLLQMNTNKKFLIQNDSEQILGKGPQADILLQNPVVSREHAKITCSGGRCILRDLGSKNGTFLNERQLLANESVQLASGDYITLGNEILKFEQ